MSGILITPESAKRLSSVGLCHYYSQYMAELMVNARPQEAMSLRTQCNNIIQELKRRDDMNPSWYEDEVSQKM